MRTSALVGAKNSGFFKIYGVSSRTRGLSQCGYFSDKGGQFFANLCGRLLWTAPKQNHIYFFISKLWNSGSGELFYALRTNAEYSCSAVFVRTFAVNVPNRTFCTRHSRLHSGVCGDLTNKFASFHECIVNYRSCDIPLQNNGNFCLNYTHNRQMIKGIDSMLLLT